MVQNFDRSSFVDFGPPKVTSMRDNSTQGLVRLPVNKDFFWSMFCQGVGFSDPQDPKNTFKFSEGSLYSVFDTGSSGIFIPTSLYNTITLTLIQHADSP